MKKLLIFVFSMFFCCWTTAFTQATTGLSFEDPTPTDGTWINYNDPVIKINAPEDISAAYLQLDLPNGGFENSFTGYETGGDMSWNIVSNTYHSGGHSIFNSGWQYNNKSSYISRTVSLAEDGEISFWYKTDTELNSDFLIFKINDVEKERFSGQQDWTEAVFPLPAGTYEFSWLYVKDASGFAGEDAIWLDDISITEGPTGEGISMDIDSEDNSIASYQLSGLEQTSYTYSVTAYDSGNSSLGSISQSFKIDTDVPTGYLEPTPYYHNFEIDATTTINVSLNDYGSYVKEVCLWLGDETENLIQADFDNCKLLNEHDSYSYDYAPGFQFRNWGTTAIADGTYNLYALVTDNAGNESKLSKTVKINNYSEGSAQNPSEISTCAEFQAMNNNLNWHYVITNDIDCTETKNWNGGQGFIGIGGNNGFTGTLDGQNYNVYSIYQGSGYTGIFDSLSGQVIGLNLRDVDLSCSTTYCGGFTHNNWGTIEKSSITGTLSCSGKCGGFASQQSGTISQCWGDMVIGSGGYQGGIAGQNFNGYIDNTYFKGEIIANNGGGLVGLNEGGWGGGIITNSYSNAEILGGDWNTNGGLVGWMYSYSSQSGSYWNKELSGKDNMCGTKRVWLY